MIAIFRLITWDSAADGEEMKRMLHFSEILFIWFMIWVNNVLEGDLRDKNSRRLLIGLLLPDPAFNDSFSADSTWARD